mgnify:CR=1 FL=1
MKLKKRLAVVVIALLAFTAYSESKYFKVSGSKVDGSASVYTTAYFVQSEPFTFEFAQSFINGYNNTAIAKLKIPGTVAKQTISFFTYNMHNVKSVFMVEMSDGVYDIFKTSVESEEGELYRKMFYDFNSARADYNRLCKIELQNFKDSL